jgi:DNA-binding NarL/FixJ family response regulator
MGASALIIAQPGPLRDGLHALVGTMPQIGGVDVTGDLESAFKATFNECPALVLLDAHLNGGKVWLTVRRAKVKWPRARTIVLAGNVEQQEEASAAGADVVLLEGLPAGRLVAAIVKLLPQPIL